MRDPQPPGSWDLTGKVALVTGAARGIGEATAKLLRQRGASVVASDLSAAVTDLEGDGLVTIVGDVSSEDMARRSVALALESFGRLDILVNNAGRTLNKPLLDTSLEDWQALFDVNVSGTFLHSREAVRAMLTSGGGTLVNLTSIVARVAMKETAAYAASKGAIAQLTKVIGVEYGDRGIRANALAPGVVETDILEGIVDDSRATLASYASAHPLGRVGQPQDIAEIAAFLASPASSFMTGALVMADGGYTAL
ncbi:SDR family oxidoreductase [Salinicola sp. CPA57]|uniref:SDR family NAD(P)-dependent oxidoreductase n=1 Tax=Salinicola sp. CPA57 TaxID=1949080 RepID=UPI000DA10D2B|nr:SDR family oxidoreductase [Salinicola sp. CPA57]